MSVELTVAGGSLLRDLWEVEHHETLIFPDDTNLTCTLTAHEDANTWSSWAEIVDSEATTLSSKFATQTGHLVAMTVESVSEENAVYMVEFAYGDDKTVVSRWRFAGATKFLNPIHQVRMRGVHIPAGEKIYYRAKTETAVADTALVYFRYFLHI